METNGNDRPITLKDLTDAEARIEDRILKGVDERLQDIETKLLTAFHGTTERNDLRFKRIEAAEATTVGRVASLEAESRFTALELRVIETEKSLRQAQQRLQKLEENRK